MKILHLIHQYLPDYVGGSELYTQQLGQQLVQQGHEVSVFFRRDGKKAALDYWQEESGIEVWAATAKPVTLTRRLLTTFGDYDLGSSFAQVIAKTQPDVVHIQHMMGMPASLVKPLIKQQIPYLITLHDYWWRCPNAQLLTNYSQEICQGPRAWINCGRCSLARAGLGGIWPLSPLIAPLLAARESVLNPILHHAKAIIAPTQFLKDVYVKLGLPAERIQVVRHGISVPEHINRQSRPSNQHLHIGYVGGISPQKGVLTLVTAFNKMPAETQLTIAGDLTTFPDYAAQLKEANQHDGLHFAGKLSHNEVWGLLQKINLLVVPSLWYEAAGLVIQEAFAAGVPVAASDLGALPESVREGVDGLLFPAGDVAALANVLRDLVEKPEILEGLNAGISPVRTIQEHVADVLAVYAKGIN